MLTLSQCFIVEKHFRCCKTEYQVYSGFEMKLPLFKCSTIRQFQEYTGVIGHLNSGNENESRLYEVVEIIQQ